MRRQLLAEGLAVVVVEPTGGRQDQGIVIEAVGEGHLDSLLSGRIVGKPGADSNS
jgi:hypothetical protein